MQIKLLLKSTINHYEPKVEAHYWMTAVKEVELWQKHSAEWGL